jgi:hypothetical protein
VELFLGVVFIAAGVLLPVLAYYDKVGQFGFGTEAAMRRRRLLTRGKAFLFGPVFVVDGILLLVND